MQWSHAGQKRSVVVGWSSDRVVDGVRRASDKAKGPAVGMYADES
jgi:hypothetical protein